MSREFRKTVIKISLLALLLVALILVLVLVVIPLLNGDDGPGFTPPHIEDGEGLYNNRLVTIYPQLDKQKINFLEIENEHGKYAFHKYYNSSYGMEGEEMRFLGHEAIEYNQSMYAVLIAYIYLPVSYGSDTSENAPMRDMSEAKMKEYGVTEDTCIASYTVGYEDEDGTTNYYTVYIGHPTFSSETTYYVSLKGRNTVYRFHQEGVESCLMASMEDYLSPLIFSKYSNVNQAMVEVTRFKIGVTDPAKINTPEYISTLIEIAKTGQNLDGTSNMYDLLYKSRGTGAISRIGANATTIGQAFAAFYTYFQGDKVISVEPSIEELDKYGLGEDDSCYYITAQFSDKEGDTYSLQISDLIDGYYYTLANTYGEGNSMLVRIPQSTLTFLGKDDKAVFSWAGSDISSLFYEYLIRNDEAGEPGIKQIVVRSQKKNDTTGEITYNFTEVFDVEPNGNGGVIATRGDGFKYVSLPNANGELENQFTDFYRMLVFFPNPSAFNNMTQAEIDALMADDSAVVFELIATTNDNKIQKYTYYQIGNSLNVMIAITKGEIVNGEAVWGETGVNFNTAISQLDILRINLQKLLNGEDVRPEDYIY